MVDETTLYAGIDIGSRTVKGVLLRAQDRRVIASAVMQQGVEQELLATQLLDDLLGRHGLERRCVAAIVATGYGRNSLSIAARTVTEIHCHARGVLHRHPDARTVIEIGGQDSKLIRIDERGSVYDFAMNDRCAAGTGQFLELAARKLGISLNEIAELGSKSTNPAAISSMCAVFAETEIIGLLADKTPRADIVAGVCRSVANRLLGLTGGKTTPPVYFTGGVAMVPGMAEAIAEVLNCEVRLAAEPQITGALGAALTACRDAGGLA